MAMESDAYRSMDSAPSTPVRMNIIEEEENIGVPNLIENNCSDDKEIQDNDKLLSGTPHKRLSSFYSLSGENDSSSSLVATKGFSFGGSTVASNNSGLQESGNKRQSFKYIPGPKLPPVSRARSPVRNTRSPSPDRSNRRNSALLDVPFNFSSSSLQPPTLPGSAGSLNAVPNSGGSGNGRSAVFRKGHRYKHSSVSMNFFQEPEVKVPLNIIKSLPVPEFKDLRSNLIWPKTHIQLSVIMFEICISTYVFHRGHSEEWSSMSTLAHFLSYDILGSIFSILTDLLSQFEVWKTGTITLPFGLNRIDVLLSFAFAISICFVGLDLLFHVLEEAIVLFAESTSREYHDEINQTIPHSHHTHVHNDQLYLWYSLVLLAAFASSMSLIFIFRKTHYKIKQSLITLSYILYLALFPIISYLHHGWDMLATVLISIFIIGYGIKVAKWTYTILLMGFSTTSLNNASLLVNEEQPSTVDKNRVFLKRSKSTLPLATTSKSSVAHEHHKFDPVFAKSKIYDAILSIPNFQQNCSLKSSELIISKVTFQLFIILMKVQMKDGSNEEELDIRMAITKLIQGYIPDSEITIEIERI